MTISLTIKNQNRGGPTLRAAGGFTIMELMVVLLIMLLLLAVLAPTVQKIQQTVLRTSALATIHLIKGACDEYYGKFGEYPPSRDDVNYAGWDGKELLVLFLTGYGPDAGLDGTPGTDLSLDDGKEGFGTRVEKRGLVFGPYNGAETVKTTRSSGNNRTVFVDSFDEEVYYYRYDPLFPGYHTEDNLTPPPGLEAGSAYDDYLANAKTMREGFILMTAGPNGVCEAFDDTPETDDITNFLEEQY